MDSPLGIMQYAARLADYAALIRDKSRWVRPSAGGVFGASGTMLNPNPNRVAVLLSVSSISQDLSTGNPFNAHVVCQDANGFDHVFQELFVKESDVAAGTPSPFFLSGPLRFDLLEWGYGIQGTWTLATNTTFMQVTCVELVYSGPNQPTSSDR